MKKRLLLAPLIGKIASLGFSMGGVFSYSDLFNVIATGSPLKNTRMIKRLVREGVLFKICRGFYTTDNPDLWTLASRLRTGCAISLDSVLSKNGLVGTVPERSVSAVSASGRKQNIQTPFGLIRYFSIRKNIFSLGVERMKNGIFMADSEKAYLDLLYFYTKGARFVFDPRREVNVKKLDAKKIQKYLLQYRNKRFVQFVKGLLNENS